MARGWKKNSKRTAPIIGMWRNKNGIKEQERRKYHAGEK
jgi:hypothetical protein